MNINQIDEAVKGQGVDFDSCIEYEQGLLYFKNGLLVAEVKATIITFGGIGQINLDIFKTSNKLREKNE